MESADRAALLHHALLLVLLLAPGGAVAVARHTYSQVSYCQKDEPLIAAAETFDKEEILSFDFSEGVERARIPDFEAWAKAKSTAAHNSKMQNKEKLCQDLLQFVPIEIYNITHLPAPEERDQPVVSVYTMDPLEYEKPNTLICFVDKFFPPTLSISWYMNDTQITSRVSTTDAYPKADFGFQMFGYLNFIPKFGDKYSCHIEYGPSQYPLIEYWVPETKPKLDSLMLALYSVAFALGLLGIIGGIVFLILGIKRRRLQDD